METGDELTLTDELLTLLTEIQQVKQQTQAAHAALRQLQDHRYQLVEQALATGRVNMSGISLFCGEPPSATSAQQRAHNLRARQESSRTSTAALPDPDDTPPAGGTDLITSADIARLAGLTRASISNWKRRHPDFPAPADDALPARYRRRDVRQFFARHNITEVPAQP